MIDQNSAKIQGILDNLSDPNFDIFKLDEISGKKTLLYLSEEVFKRYDFFEYIDEKVFTNFITAISEGYDRKIAYHNVKLMLNQRTYMQPMYFKHRFH